MSVTATKYSCKNCGSVFEPGLKAEFEHIKVRCPFCRNEAALVPIPEFETPEQYEKRTGEKWPNSRAVYYYHYGYGKWYTASFEFVRFWRCDLGDTSPPTAQFLPQLVVVATEAGPPPDDWRPK